MLVVVAVGFAVGGDVRELGGVVGAGGLVKPPRSVAEVFAGVEQAFKGDGARGGAVVEEDGDGAAFVERDEVGLGGVDGGVGGGVQGGVGAGCRTGVLASGRTRAHWLGARMVKLDAFLRHEVEDVAVDGGFGEPHAFGLAAEAGFEVGDAPADLGAGVARRWRAA